jgi:hypothetical protein
MSSFHRVAIHRFHCIWEKAILKKGLFSKKKIYSESNLHFVSTITLRTLSNRLLTLAAESDKLKP